MRVVEDGEDLLAAEVAVGGGRGEAPEGDVLEGLLPAGEEGRRDAAGLGGPVELCEAAGAVGVGVVGRQPGLLEERGVGVVQRADRAAELGREPRAVGQRGEVEGVPRQVGVDRRAAAAVQGHEPARRGHGEGQPAREQPEQRDGAVHLGARDLAAGDPHDPAAVLLVLDEGDVEGLPGEGGECLDAHRVQTRDGGTGQGGELCGAAVHVPHGRRCPPPRLGGWPVPSELFPTSPSPGAPSTGTPSDAATPTWRPGSSPTRRRASCTCAVTGSR